MDVRHQLLCFLVPGLVALSALPLHVSFDVTPRSISGVTAAIALAYVAGHLLQALAAIPEKFLPSVERRAQAAMPGYVVEAARAKMALAVATTPEKIDSTWLYRLCHAWVGRNVDPARRPGYRTYESLYRGLAAALLVLALALAARAIRGETHVTFGSMRFGVTAALAAPLALALPVVAAVCFRTGRRFGGLRVRHAILTFATAGKEEAIAEAAQVGA